MASSPTSVTSPSTSAATAARNRTVVPLLPTKSGPSGACSRARPPCTTSVSPGRVVDVDAHARQRRAHVPGVVALERAGQPRLAVGERRQHQGAVGDALRSGDGPGHVDGAGQARDDERRDGTHARSLSHARGRVARRLDAGAERDADGVAGEIAPQEPVAEDQRAGQRVPDRVNPRRVIELAHFNRARTRERGDGEAQSTNAGRVSRDRRTPWSRKACRRRRSRSPPAASPEYARAEAGRDHQHERDAVSQTGAGWLRNAGGLINAGGPRRGRARCPRRPRSADDAALQDPSAQAGTAWR